MPDSTLAEYVVSLPENQAVHCRKRGVRVTGQGVAWLTSAAAASVAKAHGESAIKPNVAETPPTPARKPKTTRSKAKAKPAPIPAEAPAKVEG